MSEAFIKKNVTLSLELDEYLVKHPELYRSIPNGAFIVITIKSDPKFSKESISLVTQTRRKNIIEAHKSGSGWSLKPFHLRFA